MAGLPKYFGLATTSIDAKNRITIPAKFRKKLPTQSDGKAVLYVMYGADFRCLDIFDSESGALRMAELSGESGLPSALQRERKRMMARVEEVELDKQGRVLLPKDHVEWAGLKGEVLVAGCGDHLEVYVSGAAAAVGAPVPNEDLDPTAIAGLYNGTLPEQD